MATDTGRWYCESDAGTGPTTGITAGLVSLATLAVGLGGFALGVDWAWVAFPVGYSGVLPLAIAYSKRSSKSSPGDSHGQDALAVARERYASGEIDETEFEHRVERLLESEERPGDDSPHS
jgi:hypothetical protein